MASLVEGIQIYRHPLRAQECNQVVDLHDAGPLLDVGGHGQMWLAAQRVTHERCQIAACTHFYEYSHAVIVHCLNRLAETHPTDPVCNSQRPNIVRAIAERRSSDA